MPQKRPATQDCQRSRKRFQPAPLTVQDWVDGQVPSRMYCAKRSLPSIIDEDPPPAPKRQRTAPSHSRQAFEPGRLPLTRGALRRLDQSTRNPTRTTMASQSLESLASDASTDTINAYHPQFETELNLRRIYCAEDELDQSPSNLGEVTEAVFAARKSPDPNETDARNFRKRIRKAPNESATVQSILPKIVPLEDLMDSDTASTAPDQPWHRRLLSYHKLKPCLATPKPDNTVGWSPNVFPYPKTSRLLKDFILPVAQNAKLAWPLFTIEVKGDKGNLKVAKLQNLHNAAIMLSNLLQLRQACGKEKDFFHNVHVLSLELTTESIQLSCYWASRHSNGEASYHGKSLACWSPNDPSGKGYIDARRCVRNAMEWVKNKAHPWIDSDMKSLETKLEVDMSQITPPQSQSDQGNTRKRRLSRLRSESRTRARSSSSQRRK